MKAELIPLTIPMSFFGIEETIHPTLLWDGTNAVLVDCGYAGSLPLIEVELGRIGIPGNKITTVVLTHQDHDHMGAAADFKDKYPSITVIASKTEEPYIAGKKKSLRLLQAEALQQQLPPEQQGFGEAFCAMLRRVRPVPVDVVVEDGDQFDWCGGCQIIATPGHTPGHVSLYLPTLGALIAGDAIALEDNAPTIANPQFTLDVEAAHASMNKLLLLPADRIDCYHGGKYRTKK